MTSYTNNQRSEAIIDFMKKIEKWDISMLKEIPYSFEKFGVHLLFSEPAFAHKNWTDAGENFWQLICKLYSGEAVAVKGSIQNNCFRSPNVRFLYGTTTLVNFTDNRIKYTWDIVNNMFSVGNVNERHRIARLKCEGEVIVDLFAGIGYFTLPYLVHAKAEFVHACEWSNSAVEALKRNLLLNKVANRCQIYEGDNRKVSPKRVADRVNLGLIPSSEDYWQLGCECLKEQGGILYIHENVASKFEQASDCKLCTNFKSTFDEDAHSQLQLTVECFIDNDCPKWSMPQEYPVKYKHKEWFIFAVHVTHSVASILSTIYSRPWKVCVREIFKVKSYAPHIDHLVYAVHCCPYQLEIG